MKPAWAGEAKTGPVRSYMELKVFACQGLICIIDERQGEKEGEYTIVTPADLDERITALNIKYRGKGRMDVPRSQRQNYDAVIRGSQNCVECIKEARAMGDPSSPDVQAYWARHRRSSTVRFNFSAGADPGGYPVLPQLPRGPVTGRTAIADDSLLLPSVAGTDRFALHVPPKKKNRNGIILLD